ncbi:MerR family transcriptional regulator [Roseivivax sp. CAU 1753]
MSKSPDAFRTISEVADWLETPAHVLRFWESKFPQVKPVKRAGGRRYYRPSDMMLLGGIKKLLHDDGMTIKGVQKILSEQGVKSVSDMAPPIDDNDAEDVLDAVETPDRDVPARIDDEIEDAPFIEAEPPASTVVPFTGGTLAETPAPPANAETDSAEAPVAPLPEGTPDAPAVEDVAPEPEPEVLQDAAAAQQPDPPEVAGDTAAKPDDAEGDSVDATDRAEPVIAGDAPDAPDEAKRPEDAEAASAPDLTPEDSAADTPSVATDSPDDADAAVEISARAASDEAEAQPSLFGPTPEFLSKPFSDRAARDGDAARTADADPVVTPVDDDDTPREDNLAEGATAAADRPKAAPSEPASETEIAEAADPVPPPNTDAASRPGHPDNPPEADPEEAAAEDAPAVAPPSPGANGTDRIESPSAPPEPGPLHHLAKLDRLSPEDAARLAPVLEKLRAHVGA